MCQLTLSTMKTSTSQNRSCHLALTGVWVLCKTMVLVLVLLHTYGDDIKPSISGATAHAETTHWLLYQLQGMFIKI